MVSVFDPITIPKMPVFDANSQGPAIQMRRTGLVLGEWPKKMVPEHSVK